MNINKSMKTILPLAALALVTTSAQAATTVDYTQNGVVIANDFGDFTSTYDIGNIHDQSGLSANYVSGVTVFELFSLSTTVTTNGNVNDAWFGANAAVPGNIDFDLGSEFTVTQIALWNWLGGGPENAWDDFTVFIDDNSAFSSPVNTGSFNFAMATTGASQVFDVTDATGRFVRIRLTSDTDNAGLIGIGEVVFATAVPEPSSTALLGLGGLALMLRRRR